MLQDSVLPPQIPAPPPQAGLPWAGVSSNIPDPDIWSDSHAHLGAHSPPTGPSALNAAEPSGHAGSSASANAAAGAGKGRGKSKGRGQGVGRSDRPPPPPHVSAWGAPGAAARGNGQKA